MALWQARQVCPEIVFVPPRMDVYLRFSRLAHEIYADYTDLQEAFWVDESWLDVTDSASLKGDGLMIATQIGNRIKYELEIQRVKHCEKAASRKAGGVGLRFTCMIAGEEHHLYYEENYRWFMERKERS